MTKARERIDTTPPLKQVSDVFHLMRFTQDQTTILALLDFGNEVNSITPAYMAKLGLKIQPINVET